MIDKEFRKHVTDEVIRKRMRVATQKIKKLTDEELKELLKVVVQKMKELDKLLEPMGNQVVMISSISSVTPIECAKDIELRWLNKKPEDVE
ncbi:hypothetical protein LCGC14_1806260 [marine sediment metagenome]|uniref:Uncharacterized protein n=1 Tax=marine sediment metagenome TaxID=412755 RepID=A0A0F9JMV1_9ZZZZ